ncbi:twin-arginine translocase subunit TatC [Effusibacillus lacus]|uniref:Sec-independent protein translocase protein TatC n=1 Tax=Effusibacillus lacus TaxID=1348429 RepID=A0A292YJ35_9BACL|nr:twin-arginine translocase subunit TatC [Effusibacillus lacus]TCS74326.1 sec-independent protein translocase protein TatC [Effusibacillus lacus]GAX88783.1 twin arginine-targeting protein translocase TatC [Effusibacillus lacus]
MDQEQNLVEHLAELRKRLIITLVAFVVFLVLSFAFVENIFEFLKQGMPQGTKMVVLGPSEVLRVYMIVAGVTAIGMTIPVLLYQAWKFVAPGLTETEKKVTASFIPIISLVFFAGIAFGYYAIFPTIYEFFVNLGNTQFEMMQTAGNYFSFMANIVVPFGFIFELPIVVLFLTRLGILTPQFLTKNRKYAYFLLVVIGVILSPPEPVSDIITTLPMILLYEIGVTLSRIAYKKRMKQLKASGLAD